MKTLITVIIMMMSMSVQGSPDELTEEERERIWSVANVSVSCAVLIKAEYPESEEISEYAYDLLIGATELYEAARPGEITPEDIRKSVEADAEWAKSVPRETVERVLKVCYNRIIKITTKNVEDLQLNLDYRESLSM